LCLSCAWIIAIEAITCPQLPIAIPLASFTPGDLRRNWKTASGFIS